MIPAVIQAWRDRKKAAGYCQFCWKRKATATKSLCRKCRIYKIDYEATKRLAMGRKPRGKPLPRRYKRTPVIDNRPAMEKSFVNAAYERQQLAKLERQEAQRKAVQAAWYQQRGIEKRA